MELHLIEKIAAEKFAEFGITDWEFGFDNRTRAFGTTRFREKKVTMSKSLTLSNDEAQCLDTLLHEIAHVIAGPRAGHGIEWKRVARRVGAQPRATVRMSEINKTWKWRGTCLTCPAVFHRDRRKTTAMCATCYNAGNRNAHIQWAPAS